MRAMILPTLLVVCGTSHAADCKVLLSTPTHVVEMDIGGIKCTATFCERGSRTRSRGTPSVVW
jgi:hypothetical protein